ncbi:MAG: conjugal transfer protein TraF, partial [Ectothiorhodospiraceae bacterium]|nr:conjugal transfer protein TraF [Ectothiorhodospiraceae bacterium]
MVSIPIGQDITHGGVSHPRTLQATGNNPASAAASERRGVWFGLGAVSLGYEMGSVDNLIERAERFEEELDRDDLTLEEAEALKDEFDQFLLEVGRDGYVKAGGSVQLPFTPMGANVSMLGGAISFEARGVGGARGRILDAPIEIQPVGGGDFELQSRTSAYVKGAVGYQLALGYSAGVLQRPEGALFVGGRLNYYKLELAKGVIALEDTDDGEDFSDGLEDDFDRNRKTSSAVGLDLGALWVARHYQLGGTIRNLNEPEFDYPSVGKNCNDPGLSEVARRNCFTAALFFYVISMNEIYTMERQLQLEGGIFTANRNWSLGVAYDVNSTR